LIDLGPDGLGFIIPSDHPGNKLAFSVRHLKSRNFEDAGLHEGDWVEFHLDDKRQIECVTPIL
jgi:hypothetical protein